MKDVLKWTDTARHFIDAEEKAYTWWSYRNRDWKKSNRGRRLDHIWVTEIWDSKEDHGNSLQSAKVKELIVKALPILEDQPEGNPLNVLGGFGLS